MQTPHKFRFGSDNCWYALMVFFFLSAFNWAPCRPYHTQGADLDIDDRLERDGRIDFRMLVLIGTGLGPLVTGKISDILIGNYGLEVTLLRYAIAASLLVAVISAFLLWRASRHYISERSNVVEMHHSALPSIVAAAT